MEPIAFKKEPKKVTEDELKKLDSTRDAKPDKVEDKPIDKGKVILITRRTG
jgi:hypothetical protein